jgi:5-oxoprolinase (ATP-hydrolysing)
MSVAEAMGRAIQQTSISTNIKERLDYSCALFSANGDLVASAHAAYLTYQYANSTWNSDCVQANAPFIPVHLGSMSFAIKYQLDLLGPSLKPGDVLLANSPVAGGSHLPDLTVITPVFASSPSSRDSSTSTSSSGDQNEDISDAGKQEIIFFTASRGHHADIGGAQPGSMPSYSTSLSQEGAEIVSFKLVTEGKFDREGLRRRMVDVPGEVEGCSGCRDFRSVESDIKAVSVEHGVD